MLVMNEERTPHVIARLRGRVRRLLDLRRLAVIVRRAMLRKVTDVGARLPERTQRRLDFPGPVLDVVPTESQLRRWAVAIGLDYQAWVFHHGFVTLEEWRRQRTMALDRGWSDSPLISILTPVFDTPVEYLRECVYSVQAQSYPYWELCLVDDGSTSPETLAELDRLDGLDARIRVVHLPENLGICGATNEALAMSQGRYVGFLDHDDRLAPEALHHVSLVALGDPGLDIVYSDRDLLTPENFRTEPTFKPGWAPETLLSGNYMFHFTVYSRELAQRLGGFRKEFEGSQDLDLALRAAETDPAVAHIPLMLYHWRQQPESMAMFPERKPFIFDAGIRAVRAALERRGLEGEVEEIPDIWRGNYRVRLAHEELDVEVVRITDIEQYRADVEAALSRTSAAHLVVLGPGVEPADDGAIAELVAWLRVPGVVATTGRVVDGSGRLRHAGLVDRPGELPLAVFAGHDVSDPGYAAATVNIRNVSLAHPLCTAWRVDECRTLGGFAGRHVGPFAGLDASIRSVAAGRRLVYDALATFVCDDEAFDVWAWSQPEPLQPSARRRDLRPRDPLFNPAFEEGAPAMRIDVASPGYESDLESSD